jgi:acyl-CoA reductase-like NAD-dependent aldehyde dehydrogenase
MSKLTVVNPFTLEVSEVSGCEDPRPLYTQAKQLGVAWSSLPVSERVAALQPAYEALVAQTQQLALTISTEMGKPITQARLEIERTAEEFGYMLEHAQDFLAPEPLELGEIHYAPLGVVAVISPWNFPILLPLRGIVPALLAGNSVIFKPSELTPKSGLALSGLFSPTTPLVTAVGDKSLGAQVTRLPVAAICFTGSTDVGKEIAQVAAHDLKRLQLELGGLDAAIVMADADLASSASAIITTNARNCGQACNSIKRVYVHEQVFASFVEHARKALFSLRYGDPLSETTDIGPLVSASQYARVKSFLDDALATGAKAISAAAPKQGYLFPQTILTGLSSSAKLLSEEPFGPLLPVIPFKTEAEAISLANSTRYGLTASIWTKDPPTARRLALQLDVGIARHNTHAPLPSGYPWGGSKQSGLGRMKCKEGLRELTNIKVIA